MIKADSRHPIDIYPVGVLARLLRIRRAIASRRPELIRWALGGLLTELRYVAGRIRRSRWRDAKNAFNGYLAEPRHWPDGLRRCGTGWTRKRALRSLCRRAARAGATLPTDRP